MSTTTNTPGSGDAPSLESLGALQPDALIDRYVGGVHALDPRLLEADDDQQSVYFRPDAGVGRWSCRALVVHLADVEMVIVHRMRRVVAEDRPMLALFDEHAFIDGCLSDAEGGATPPPLAGAIATVHTLRLWTADWLRTLPGTAWAREALHPEQGSLTLRELLLYDTWHLEHHARFLTLKLDRLLGPSGPGVDA